MLNQWPWMSAVIVTVALIGGIVALDSQGKKPVDATVPTEVAQVDVAEWMKGNPDAPVTLIEYSDFQCPACGNYYPILKKLIDEHGQKVRFVYRHFPLPSHANADDTARAAEAAGLQGKFWEMHDQLFEHQGEWSTLDDSTDAIVSYARAIELDTQRFQADLESEATDDTVDADRQSGNEAHVSATPTFILNGKRIRNPQSLDEFVALIDAATSQEAPNVETGN